MKIAVTGGGGHIGRRTCRELIRAGHEPVVMDLVPGEEGVPSVRVDLCDSGAALEAFRGMDAVVHLAAIPNPFSDPPERVMGINCMLSLNVFEAARVLGIRRVVYGCSESATGFGIHTRLLKPLYVPVDESHPCWPHETYSLSKYFGELIGENYSKVYGLEVVSLRYTGVWFEEMRKNARPLLDAKRAGELPESPWFGAYISVGDVARAIVAGLEYRPDTSSFFDAFLLTARDTLYGRPTLEVLEAIYGGACPEVRDPGYFQANPFASVFDIRKAERLLGWRPRDRIEEIDRWEF